ncbi:bifunctional nuclease family protein [Lunatimonas salinarum]|uniref:bifunctional nuclease family protein n=1 Tax=Lunatimonas salinarum TaxID=1774590 RepID=UPI001ADFCB79
MENAIELEIIGLTASHSQSGSFTLVLGELDGRRRLPIIIGMFEAQAIAIELEKITPNRPMTHDLVKSFSKHFDFTVEYILISDMREGVFYAKIVCQGPYKRVEIDARPSDAVAIAVRFGAPVYCSLPVMEEAGIEEAETNESTGGKATEERDIPSTKKKEPSLKDYSLEKLNQLLEKAIQNEDYEKAARLRDEINRRN